MRNVTMAFLVLLVLATLTFGTLWKRSMMLGTGHGTVGDMIVIFLSVVLLIFALLGLSRILYRITLVQHASNATGAEEKSDV